MVPLESLRSLRSLRIFSVDTMCVNKRSRCYCTSSATKILLFLTNTEYFSNQIITSFISILVFTNNLKIINKKVKNYNVLDKMLNCIEVVEVKLDNRKVLEWYTKSKDQYL